MGQITVIATMSVEAESTNAAIGAVQTVLERGWRRGEGVGGDVDFVTTEADAATVRKLFRDGGVIDARASR